MTTAADLTVVVEIAFATDPFDTPTWTDVSEYVEALSGARGKGRVLDQMPAGTCDVVLDNTDGRFDPNNTSSPYYPNVLPMRRIRVRVGTDEYVDEYEDEYTGDTYPLFSGFILSWPQEFLGQTSWVSVHAVDGIKVCNMRTVSATYSAERSGARIDGVLDDIDWPSGDRSVTGVSTQSRVAAKTLAGANPWTEMQQVAATENGLLFVAANGDMTFIDRHTLMESEVKATFSDQPDDVAFESVVVSFDDTDLFNEITLSSPSLSDSTASDADSQAAYLVRTLSNSLQHQNQSEQDSAAEYLLVGYSQPAPRVDQLNHDPVHTADEWDAILARDLGDKVVVARETPGGQDISQRSYIEGIQWRVQSGGPWRFTWRLVPTTRRADFWILGDEVQGVLGVTTRLGY